MAPPLHGGETVRATLSQSLGSLASLLGLLHDGAHGRDNGGLGAAGTGGHGDNSWQGGRGGEDGGLGYCRHRDGRVPLALSLLGVWGRGQREVRTHLGQWSETREQKRQATAPGSRGQPGSRDPPQARSAMALLPQIRQGGPGCVCGGREGGSRPYLRRLCWPWWWWWPGRWSWYPSWCPSQTQSGGERDERALGPAHSVHASCLLLGGQEATWHRTREALRTSCDCRVGEALERRLERTVTPRKRASRRHGPSRHGHLCVLGHPCPPRPRPHTSGEAVPVRTGEGQLRPPGAADTSLQQAWGLERGKERELGNSIKG